VPVQVLLVRKYNSMAAPALAWQTPAVFLVVVSRWVHPVVSVPRKESMREWPTAVAVRAKVPRQVHQLAWVNQVRPMAVPVRWELVAVYQVEHLVRIQPIWLNTATPMAVNQPRQVPVLRKLQA
jgi:hypothetical protein